MQLRCARTDQRTGTRRIGPDVCVRDQSEGGAVRRYATRSGGSERAHLARDLSVNRKGGGRGYSVQFTIQNPRFRKMQFFEIGPFAQRDIELAQNGSLREWPVLTTPVGSAGSSPANSTNNLPSLPPCGLR